MYTPAMANALMSSACVEWVCACVRVCAFAGSAHVCVALVLQSNYNHSFTGQQMPSETAEEISSQTDRESRREYIARALVDHRVLSLDELEDGVALHLVIAAGGTERAWRR